MGRAGVCLLERKGFCAGSACGSRASRQRARGGTDHGNNLYPAAISVNRSKQDRSSRSVRREYGLTRAPPSLNKCLRELEDAQEQAQLAGGLGGAGLGLIRLTFRWKPSP